MNLSSEKPRWVQVARILRPRGNKGEVLAELLTDFAARLSTFKELYLSSGGREPQATGLRNFWVDRNHPEHGIFHFAGSDSIDAAEKLRGLDVFLPITDRVELSAGQYFVSDLIGCTVFETMAEAKRISSPACEMPSAPQVLGTVKDVFFPGEGSLAGTPLLQVQTARGELLVPLAEDICRRVDVAERRIDVTLPEGLQELIGPE